MSEAEKVVALGTDFTLVLVDLQDRPLMTRDNEGEMKLTLGEACSRSLMAALENDKSDGVEKIKRFNLAQKILKAEEKAEPVIVSSKDKKRILDMAEKVYPTLFYARVYEGLEGTTELG